MQYEPQERAVTHFAFGFKPDLVKSERARRDAWAFLLKARQDAQRVGLPRPIACGGMAVVVGVPAEVGDEHKRLTAEAARAAGFGTVECVAEPLGALAFHLSNGDLTPTEARAGVVVVDFGGGTLDVALVNAEGLREPWGDAVLGGRLFDDLFFQWVADQNAPLEIDDCEAQVVWQRECRELKEAFSNRWRSRGDAMDDFKGHIFVADNKKWLKNASVREFEERARAYRPSRIVRNYFRGLDHPFNSLVLDTPLDLFDWVRRTLTRGRAVAALRGQFTKVILTGGSCHWPFMSGLAAEAFGVDEKDILLSQTPETTIGSGLALYNVLKLKNDVRRRRLRDDKPAAVAQFRIAVVKRLDHFADETAESLVRVLLPRVEAVFQEWYTCGGSLKHVEDRIASIGKVFEQTHEAEAVLKPQVEALATDVMRLLRDHLKLFLAEHEIPKDVFRYVPDTASVPVDPGGFGKATGDKIVAEVGNLAGALTALAASIATMVVAAVKYKLVILLAAVHPVLAALAVATLLLTFLGLGKAAKDVVETYVKNYEFGTPSLWVLHRVLSKSKLREKLAQSRATTLVEIRSVIREGASRSPTDGPSQGESIEEVAVRKFEIILDLVIQDLGVLELVDSSRR
ncbi:MAG TPA: Hsp70 family protein [Gemmataceae bacterium]